MLRTIFFVGTFFLLSNTALSQAVWQVNTTNDANDGACNAAHCSLREAINAANVNLGPDSIVFNIPGGGPHTISPLSDLPGILDSFLVIDGVSQPGNSPMAGLVRIDGSNLSGPANHGLVIYVRHVKIYGLQIQNFPADGIQIFGGFADDLFISDLTIGGVDKGNVLISNGANGIEGPVDENLMFSGNYIGTDLQFSPGLGNGWNGAFIDVLSGRNTTIGGNQNLGEQNYFCSNAYSGLHLNISDETMLVTGFQITGNVFGTGVTGNEQLGNLGFVSGGTQPGGGLLITGENGRMGIGGIGGGFVNTFAFNTNGVTIDGTNFKQIFTNSFYCNINKGISLINGGNDNIVTPTANCIRNDTLYGTAEPGANIFIYEHRSDICPNAPCQGFSVASLSIADGGGRWSMPLDAIQAGADITAIATDLEGNSSEFSPCAEPVVVGADNTGPYCGMNTDIELFANISDPSGIQNLQWLGPAGYMSQDTNPLDAMDPGEYLLVVDINGCGVDTFRTLVEFDVPVIDSITEFCLGDEFIINGNVYNVNNTQGTEVLPGAAQNGCDSVVVIDMNLSPSILGGISGPAAVCKGDMVELIFDMSGPGPFTVIYGMDSGFRDTLFNIEDGHTISVVPDNSVTYRVYDISSDRSICDPIIGSQAVIEVSDMAVSGSISDYDGFGVSCFNTNDGTVDLEIIQEVGPVQYEWSNGMADSALLNVSAGQYIVTVTDAGGCVEIDTFVLTEPDGIMPLWDQILPTCRGAGNGVIMLDTILDTLGRFSYSLDSVNFNLIAGYPVIFRDLQSGVKPIYLEDERDCVERFDVLLLDGPTPSLDIGPRIDLLAGDSVQLQYSTDLINPLVQWFPADILTCSNCPTPKAFPQSTTTVFVQLEDEEGCVASDSVLLRVFIPKRVYIPNVFSPNGDNINDLFYIQANDFVELVELFVVADRWGNIVFERRDFLPNDPGQSWDGTLDGEYVMPAVFAYHAQIRFSDGKLIPFSGTVTVVR